MIVIHQRNDDNDEPIDEQMFIDQIEDMIGRDLYGHEVDLLGDLFDEVYDLGFSDGVQNSSDE
jgi:hypothetical protein